MASYVLLAAVKRCERRYIAVIVLPAGGFALHLDPAHVQLPCVAFE